MRRLFMANIQDSACIKFEKCELGAHTFIKMAFHQLRILYERKLFLIQTYSVNRTFLFLVLYGFRFSYLKKKLLRLKLKRNFFWICLSYLSYPILPHSTHPNSSKDQVCFILWLLFLNCCPISKNTLLKSFRNNLY